MRKLTSVEFLSVRMCSSKSYEVHKYYLHFNCVYTFPKKTKTEDKRYIQKIFYS